MLKALWWKEWRETRRIIFMFMALSMLVSLALYANDPGGNKYDAVVFGVLYLLIWGFLAIVSGAVIFASERESDSRFWLLDLPVKWWKLWTGKIAYGLAVQMGFALFIAVMSLLFLRSRLPAYRLPIPEYLEDTFGVSCMVAVFILLGIFSIYCIGCLTAVLCESAIKSIVSGMFMLAAAITAGTIIMVMIVESLIFTYYMFIFCLVLILLLLLMLIVTLHSRFRRSESGKLRTIVLASVIVVWGGMLLRGGSLWGLLLQSRHFADSQGKSFGLDIVGDLLLYNWLPLLLSLTIAGMASCLFAFAVTRKDDAPRLWYWVASWNILILTFACAMAFVVSGLSSSKTLNYRSDFFYDVEKTPGVYSLTLDIDYSFGKKTFSNLSTEQFLLDIENGVLHSYAKNFSTMTRFFSCSPDKRWVIYASPVFKYGLAWSWGVWAEDMETHKRCLLATCENEYFQGGWSMSGKQLTLLIKPLSHRENVSEATVFSMDGEEPRMTGKRELAGRFEIIGIVQDTGDVYLREIRQKLLLRLNSDLQQNNIKIVQDALRDSWGNGPVLSENGKFILYTIGKDSNQLWALSLQSGETFCLYQGPVSLCRYYRHHRRSLGSLFLWKVSCGDRKTSDYTERIMISNLQLKKTKVLMEAPNLDRFEWVGNNHHMLVRVNRKDSSEIRLLHIDPESLHSEVVYSVECKYLSVQPPYFSWSPDNSKVILGIRKIDNSVCYLDIPAGECKSVICPNCPGDSWLDFLCIGNDGEIYMTNRYDCKLYKVSQNNKVDISLTIYPNQHDNAE